MALFQFNLRKKVISDWEFQTVWVFSLLSLFPHPSTKKSYIMGYVPLCLCNIFSYKCLGENNTKLVFLFADSVMDYTN